MLVHTGSKLTVTLARLDADANARQPTEFSFMLMDHSDAAFLELAAAVREHKAELAGELKKALAQPAVIEGELVKPAKKPRIRKPAAKK